MLLNHPLLWLYALTLAFSLAFDLNPNPTLTLSIRLHGREMHAVCCGVAIWQVMASEASILIYEKIAEGSSTDDCESEFGVLADDGTTLRAQLFRWRRGLEDGVCDTFGGVLRRLRVVLGWAEPSLLLACSLAVAIVALLVRKLTDVS